MKPKAQFFRQILHEELALHDQRNRADVKRVMEEALGKYSNKEDLSLL